MSQLTPHNASLEAVYMEPTHEHTDFHTNHHPAPSTAPGTDDEASTSIGSGA